MDSQIVFDFYGRRTTSFIKRYRFFFETTQILSNHCHLVIINQICMALRIIFAVILTHIPGGALGAGLMMMENCMQKIVKYQSVQNTVLLRKDFNLLFMGFSDRGFY